MKFFRSTSRIQTPWGQLVRQEVSADAEKEILVAVASLVVYCCAIKKNVIVASQLCDVADVQFTAEWTE